MRIFKSKKNLIQWAPYVMLGALLALTFFIALELYRHQQQITQYDFENEVDSLSEGISIRMNSHEQILLGAAAFFAASDFVSRDEFKLYTDRLKLDKNYPGILGVGYTEWIAPDKIQTVVDRVRAEGFPDFNLHPQGKRDAYTAVIYLEPFNRNLAAFGFDMYSESVRRKAMNYAVNNNVASLTSKVKLVQDAQRKSQAGLLMYVPMYKPNMPVSTPQDRWNALQGFVYSPYRMVDLLAGILRSRNINANFKIYSGTDLTEENLLYNSSENIQIAPSVMHQREHLTLYGQIFTLDVRSSHAFEVAHIAYIDKIILFLGVISSLLVFALFNNLLNQRQRALYLADKMTQDVREKNNQLKINEERLQLALESSAMGVWSWELAENIIQWDASMFALFGLSEQKSLNSYESFLEHLHHDDRERIFKEVANAIEGKCGFDTEYRVIWPDGSIHFIASRAKISFGEKSLLPESSATNTTLSNAALMIGTCWDVTERKRLDKLKTEFVSTVSHELRTPLTAITGALGLSVNGVLGELPEKVKGALDIAYKNAQRLKLLINDLLDMDKLLAGKLEFHCEPQLLLPLIQRAVVENKAYADQYSVRYLVLPVDDAYKINVEDERFLQVMANYLSNAAKFSQPDSDVVVSVVRHHEWLRIEVSDTGSGIAADAQHHIFEKFYQVDSSDTRNKGGTGLGLAITKEIVERMNGRVGFTSNIGVGSTFYAEFVMVK